MTAVELNQVAAAVDDIAPEIYNADKKEVLAKAATFLRLFGEALDLERKTDWEKYVKKHADFLDDLAVSGLFEVVSSSKFKAASIPLNEMWQSFTHKANMLGLNHRITELEELVTRCLKTGAIRVDEHRDLWDDIHARLKLHQGESKPEPMTAHQKFKEAQGRIKELETENAKLRKDQNEYVKRIRERIPTMDKPEQSTSEQAQTQATGTAQQCFEESQEWAKRCAHSEAELTKSRATIAALESRLEEAERLIRYCATVGDGKIVTCIVTVEEWFNRRDAFLASTALKTEGGKNES